ncbi:MAG: HD domain-containing protein [Anaerovoracaceae bacterium]
MIYTELTAKASRIAYEAHRDQYDKIGMPYIFHPIHLAEQMDDEISVCVALLHDVVEDTDVTFEELAGEFPAEVIEVLKLLTHEKGEDYLEYIRRLKVNQTARKVKKADMMHNSDESRAALLASDEAREYFRNKYSKAWEELTSAE